MIAAALAAVHDKAKVAAERCTLPDDAETKAYHDGCSDAANELAILLYVKDHFDDIAARRVTEREARAHPSTTSGS